MRDLGTTLSLLTITLLAVASDPAVAQLASDPEGTRYVVAPHGNEARYRVREQLAGISFPSDAVGATRLIDGAIIIDADGNVVAGDSKFTIDLASLTSDSDRRDGYLRRRTLSTEQHPTAVFVPMHLDGLRFPLPETGDVAFRMVGQLTIREVTRPVTWDVVGRLAKGSVTGEAKTAFRFTDFELEKPNVRSVLSVDDDIRLEYTFFLVAR